MKRRRLISALLAAVLGLPCLGQTSAAQEAAPRLRVLAFYTEQTEGDHVDFAHQALRFYADEAAKEHFAWTATTDWNALNADNLKQYQLVVWLDDEPHTPQQRVAFEQYMEHGGGWIGFHASAYNDADTGWPWFVQFLGGAVFYSNNWPPLPAQLVVEPTHAAATAGLPATFTAPANEWYVWKPSPRENKDVRVLLTLSPSNCPLGLKDVLQSGDLPVAWTNTRYRMMYINMGHGARIFNSPVQNQFLRQALLETAKPAQLAAPASR